MLEPKIANSMICSPSEIVIFQRAPQNHHGGFPSSERFALDWSEVKRLHASENYLSFSENFFVENRVTSVPLYSGESFHDFRETCVETTMTVVL